MIYYNCLLKSFTCLVIRSGCITMEFQWPAVSSSSPGTIFSPSYERPESGHHQVLGFWLQEKSQYEKISLWNRGSGNLAWGGWDGGGGRYIAGWYGVTSNIYMLFMFLMFKCYIFFYFSFKLFSLNCRQYPM